MRVHDGDTFAVDGQRWRLWGIDAPELDQCCGDEAGRVTACGQLARAELAMLIGDSVPRCVRMGRSYARAVGRCHVGLVDLAAAMVRAGLALDFYRFSGGEYMDAEREARSLHRGIWAGRFVEPWVWRGNQNQRGGREGKASAAGRCRSTR